MNKELVPTELYFELRDLGIEPYRFVHKAELEQGIFYSQAFRWFREMVITRISDETSYLEGPFTLLPLIYLNGYEIHVTPESTSFTSNMNSNFIPVYEFPSKRKIYKESTENYDDAQLACLKKLIEIVKNK